MARPTQPARSQPVGGAFGRLSLLGLLIAILAAAAWYAVPRPPQPVTLTYEIDLAQAARGELTVCMVVDGDLPESLELAFPPGVFGDRRNGVTPSVASAHALLKNGTIGDSLPVSVTADGWRLPLLPGERIGFTYRIDLASVGQLEQDIRKHISAPVVGGLRAAGFEIFLQPRGVAVANISVSFRNGGGIPLVVPWNAGPITDDGPVPANLLYHPRDQRDLNNSLIACGDLRITTAEAGDSLIRFATADRWLFADRDVLQLLQRIARAEIAFFGSAPEPLITCLLAANPVGGAERFDTYGVHTGSSILLLLDAQTTYADLNESAASVLAHEMFHAWLGEAIRQVDPVTLWFTEGATTLYAARMLVAANVWSPPYGRQMLEARLARDYYGSARLSQISVATAAAQVMADPETVRFGYAGGVAVCAALEHSLIAQGSCSDPLGELLRYLYNQGSDAPLTRAGIVAAVLAVTGIECDTWLDHYVYGTEPLPSIEPMI